MNELGEEVDFGPDSTTGATTASRQAVASVGGGDAGNFFEIHSNSRVTKFLFYILTDLWRPSIAVGDNEENNGNDGDEGRFGPVLISLGIVLIVFLCYVSTSKLSKEHFVSHDGYVSFIFRVLSYF